MVIDLTLPKHFVISVHKAVIKPTKGPLKVILYSYLILKKMNERIADIYYCNKYT